MEKEYATKWLLAMGLVMLAHAGTWYGLSNLRSDIQPPRPLPVIEVALLAPPQPKVAPQPPAPPKPEPKPRILRHTEPVPRPLLAPQPEPVREMAAIAVPVVPEPAPPEPAAPPRNAPEPVLEAPHFHAAYLNNPPPAYPLVARRRGIEGRVLVRAEVQPDGSCSRAEIKTGSGSDLLDQAALEAVRKWRFVPARKGNQVLTAWVEVPITFKLENQER